MEIESEDNSKQTSLLFTKGCVIPSVKTLTFKKNEGIIFKLFYEQDPLGYNPLIGQYDLPVAKITQSDFAIKLRVKLSKNGLAALEDYNIEETRVEEVKEEPKKTEKKVENKEEKKEGDEIPEEKPDEKKEEPKKEVKTKQVTSTSKAKFSNTLSNELTPK